MPVTTSRASRRRGRPGVGAVERDMRRVLVVGGPGAGKTTFTCRLAADLQLPVIHLDFHFWRPGWKFPDPQEWREQVTTLADLPEWVMDGNYSTTYDIRMPRADSLIWLDHPRATCMRRILLRILKGYGRTRPDLPDGCPEKFDWEFIRFVWNFPVKNRPHITEGIERFGRHLRVVRLGHVREVTAFLATVGAH